jgi:hypothetical protein
VSILLATVIFAFHIMAQEKFCCFVVRFVVVVVVVFVHNINFRPHDTEFRRHLFSQSSLSCSFALSYLSSKATHFAFSCSSSHGVPILIRMLASSKATHLAFSCSSSCCAVLRFGLWLFVSSQSQGGTSGGWPFQECQIWWHLPLACRRLAAPLPWACLYLMACQQLVAPLPWAYVCSVAIPHKTGLV